MTSETERYPGYEDYSAASRSYDETRDRPVGVGTIVGLLSEADVPMDRIRLLDAGCGTGNYAIALRERVGHVDGLELNEGMLERARAKTSGHGDITLYHGSVLKLPFSEGQFDAVMLNQVIHHLDHAEEQSEPPWANLSQALSECARVLVTRGLLIINTCRDVHLEQGLWYAPLIPEAFARIRRRYVPLPTLERLLQDHGFDVGPSIEPTGEIFLGRRYHDTRGPFRESWRAGDSVWSLATEGELRDALDTLEFMHRSGRIETFMAEREQLRRAVGQSVFVRGRRR